MVMEEPAGSDQDDAPKRDRSKRQRALAPEHAAMGGWHPNSYPQCAHDTDKERADASIDAMAMCC